uniref:CSON001241 protein n=1 Tax=Culicoides sonorensis TaxID=179676 RepID=A0A336LTT8_CULSO
MDSNNKTAVQQNGETKKNETSNGVSPQPASVPPAIPTKSPPVITTTSSTPPSIPATTTQQMTANNNHSSTPPPTILAKNNSLTGPFIKKEKRQLSSKFNTSPQQSVEIETLPPLKGR